MYFRILVTGSRDFADLVLLSWHLGLHTGTGLAHGRPVVVVHGDCLTGADRLADQIARQHNILTEPHPASWHAPCQLSCKPGHRRTRNHSTYCPAAGNYRNQEMVDSGADICLAFLWPGAGNIGTRDCMNRAQLAGIPVLEHWGRTATTMRIG